MLQLSLYYGNNGPVRLTTAECCQNGETFRTLWEEPFVIVLRTDHPLAMRAHLDRADLAGVDWVVCPQHRTHQQLLPWYGQQDTLPCFAAEAGSLALALALVAAGVGLALLPASLAAGRNDLTSRALPEQGPIRQVGLCYRQPVLADETLGRLFDILQSLQAIP
jgi:DNA-binding transcriptional LysR family regulator